MSTLRGYQAEAVAALEKFYAGGGQRAGISLPTGTGKTHIMAKIGADAADERTHGRVLYLLHRDTLVEQTVAKLRATVSQGTSIGILKAERNEIGARVIVASVHSLRSAARRRQLPPINLCVVDEAHVSVTPTYRQVFDTIGAMDGGARLAGFSATWTRSDATGLGDVWQDIVYAKTIKWAVRNGHLVKPRAIQVGAGLDLSTVRVDRRTGDYSEADLGEAVQLEDLRDSVVRGVQHYGDRPAVLFAPTVAAAEYFGDGLREAGITAAGIYGITSPVERRQRFRDHREGAVRVLTTCTALAEGWDAPYCSMGLLVRPTKHEGLFVQMFGRMLRPWPGKTDALLLDFVGATDDLALRNAVDLGTSVEREDGTLIDEPIDEVPAEPVERERIVRRRKSSYEVEILPGSDVQWLTGPAGVPFVPCGEELVFIVEGPQGWNVAWASTTRWAANGPIGGWVAEGLAQEDALLVASDYAEESGQYLARRGSSWRSGAPSDAQVRLANAMGIEQPESMTRGALSDSISARRANGVLSYFADWSRRATA